MPWLRRNVPDHKILKRRCAVSTESRGRSSSCAFKIKTTPLITLRNDEYLRGNAVILDHKVKGYSNVVRSLDETEVAQLRDVMFIFLVLIFLFSKKFDIMIHVVPVPSKLPRMPWY